MRTFNFLFDNKQTNSNSPFQNEGKNLSLSQRH